MWRWIAKLALSGWLVALAGCSRAEPADVVVVAGQSNAVGYALSASELPPQLAKEASRAQIWDGARFVPMAPGRNTGSPMQPWTWGPEVGFARAWRAAHPERPLYVVKYARGSSALAAGPRLDWHPASAELFTAATTEVEQARRALQAMGRRPRVVAILWVQGETDATEPATAAAYGDNLATLISSIRGSWSADAPLVIGRIAGPMPFAAQVRAAQAAAERADRRVVTVDTAGLPRQPDGLHIAAAGQLRLGEAMARAVEASGR